MILDIRPLVWMAAQIPARQPSAVRKQSVHASLSLRRVKDQLSLTVLLQDGVVVIHRYRAVGVAIRYRPDLEHGVVQTIRQSR